MQNFCGKRAFVCCFLYLSQTNASIKTQTHNESVILSSVFAARMIFILKYLPCMSARQVSSIISYPDSQVMVVEQAGFSNCL